MEKKLLDLIEDLNSLSFKIIESYEFTEERTKTTYGADFIFKIQNDKKFQEYKNNNEEEKIYDDCEEYIGGIVSDKQQILNIISKHNFKNNGFKFIKDFSQPSDIYVLTLEIYSYKEDANYTLIQVEEKLSKAHSSYKEIIKTLLNKTINLHLTCNYLDSDEEDNKKEWQKALSNPECLMARWNDYKYSEYQLTPRGFAYVEEYMQKLLNVEKITVCDIKQYIDKYFTCIVGFVLIYDNTRIVWTGEDRKPSCIEKNNELTLFHIIEYGSFGYLLAANFFIEGKLDSDTSYYINNCIEIHPLTDLRSSFTQFKSKASVYAFLCQVTDKYQETFKFYTPEELEVLTGDKSDEDLEEFIIQKIKINAKQRKLAEITQETRILLSDLDRIVLCCKPPYDIEIQKIRDIHTNHLPESATIYLLPENDPEEEDE